MTDIQHHDQVLSLWHGLQLRRVGVGRGMADIVRQVAAEYGISVTALKRGGRSYHYTRPRQEFMWRARQVLRPDGSNRYSFPQIAAFLRPGMNHTTVIHGVRSHESRLVDAA